MGWVIHHSAGIVIHAFIANGIHQLTLVSGDYVEIFEQNGDWFRGKNLFSNQNGIFPCKCVNEAQCSNNVDETDQVYQSSLEDLLVYEAKLTIFHALYRFDKIDPETVLNVTNRIGDIIHQIDILSLPKKTNDQIYSSRQALVTNIDKLRSVFKLAPVTRGKFNLPLTLTTPSKFSYDSHSLFSGQSSTASNRTNEYIAFHIGIDAIEIKSPLNIRAYITAGNSHRPYLACPVSLLYDPNFLHQDLVIPNLEMHDLRERMKLILYVFDLPTHVEGVPDERKFISCAEVNLPFISSPSEFGQVFQTTTVAMTTTAKIVPPNFHEFLSNTDLKIIRTALSFNIKFTAYSGSAEDVINGQNLMFPVIDPPLVFPSHVPPCLSRSTLGVTYTEISLGSARKRLRIRSSLVNVKTGIKKDCLEDIIGRVMEASEWDSPVYNIGKDSALSETFMLDLTQCQSELKDYVLFLIFDRSGVTDSQLSPFAYSTIKLTDSIGNVFTSAAEGTVQLFQLSTNQAENLISNKKINLDIGINLENSTAKGKVVGSLKYHLSLASTQVTAEVDLYKLLHWEEFKEDLPHVLSQFLFTGISEWSKFVPLILPALAKIAETYKGQNEENSIPQLAFLAMCQIFGEATTRTGCPQVIEFLENGTFTEGSEAILELIFYNLKKLQDDSQEFRSLIKTLAFFMKLVSKGSSSSKTNMQKGMKQLFDKLKEFIAEKTQPNEREFVLTNQKLILQSFGSIIDAVESCFSPKESAQMLSEFVQSIPTIPSLDLPRITSLHHILMSKSWKDSQGFGVLKNLYIHELNRLASFGENDSNNKCAKGIYPLVATIFFTTMGRSEAKSYAPQFLNFIPKFDNVNRAKLILIISFSYPKDVSVSLIMDSCSRGLVHPSEALFSLLNYLNSNSSQITFNTNKSYSSKTHQEDVCDPSIFSNILSLAIEVQRKKGLGKLDDKLYQSIYCFNNDFSIIPKLFSKLPNRKQLDILPDLFTAYILFESPDLANVFYQIVIADNSSAKIDTKRATLQAIAKIQREKKLKSLTSLFDFSDTKISQQISKSYIESAKQFAEMFPLVISSFDTLNKMEVKQENENLLAEALTNIISVCEKVNIKQLHIDLLVQLIEMNNTLGLKVEAAFTMIELLKLYNVDDEEITPPPMFFSRTGRLLYPEVTFEAIQLLIDSHLEEFALTLCDDLMAKCVKPFNFIELEVKITHMKAKLYHNISRRPSLTYPNTFWLLFMPLPDKTILSKPITPTDIKIVKESYASYVLCRNGNSTLDSVKDEYKKVLGAQVFPLTPLLKEEIRDSFFMPKMNVPSYVYDFVKYNRPTAFVAEFEDHPGLDLNCTFISQIIVHIDPKNAFPFVKRRVEVMKLDLKDFSVLSTAVLYSYRAKVQLMRQNAIRKMIKKKGGSVTPQQLEKMKIAIEMITQNCLVGQLKIFMDNFLSPGFKKQNPEKSKDIEKIKDNMKLVLESVKKLGQFLCDSSKIYPIDLDDIKTKVEMIKIYIESCLQN